MASGGSDRRTYLLDTNVVLAYMRGGALGQHIEQTFGLRQLPYKPLLCVVSVGEALALAREWQWGRKRVDQLRSLLRELVWIDISAPEILEAYAEVYQASKPKGRAIQQNDLWIAATAKAIGATLLTTDRDFDHLADEHIDLRWIDPDRRRS